MNISAPIRTLTRLPLRLRLLLGRVQPLYTEPDFSKQAAAQAPGRAAQETP